MIYRYNICVIVYNYYKSLWVQINKMLTKYNANCIYCNKNLENNNMSDHVNKYCNERKNKDELDFF